MTAKRILEPQDGTPEGETVMPVVQGLARGAGATVRLLHVEPWPEAVHTFEVRGVRMQSWSGSGGAGPCKS